MPSSQEEHFGVWGPGNPEEAFRQLPNSASYFGSSLQPGSAPMSHCWLRNSAGTLAGVEIEFSEASHVFWCLDKKEYAYTRDPPHISASSAGITV